jgi:hypothetical protein
MLKAPIALRLPRWSAKTAEGAGGRCRSIIAPEAVVLVASALVVSQAKLFARRVLAKLRYSGLTEFRMELRPNGKVGLKTEVSAHQRALRSSSSEVADPLGNLHGTCFKIN